MVPGSSPTSTAGLDTQVEASQIPFPAPDERIFFQCVRWPTKWEKRKKHNTGSDSNCRDNEERLRSYSNVAGNHEHWMERVVGLCRWHLFSDGISCLSIFLLSHFLHEMHSSTQVRTQTGWNVNEAEGWLHRCQRGLLPLTSVRGLQGWKQRALVSLLPTLGRSCCPTPHSSFASFFKSWKEKN